MIFVIWLLLAVITSAVAASKGRNFFGWLLIGLIIPVIGLIIALVIGPKEQYANAGGGPAQVSGSPTAIKTCPECAETVLIAARVCKHCGYRFAGPDEDPRPRAPAIDTSKWAQRDRDAWSRSYAPAVDAPPAPRLDTSKWSRRDREEYEARQRQAGRP